MGKKRNPRPAGSLRRAKTPQGGGGRGEGKKGLKKGFKIAALRCWRGLARCFQAKSLKGRREAGRIQEKEKHFEGSLRGNRK